MKPETLSRVLHKVISKIPEAEGLDTDLMFYLVFGVIVNPKHKKLIPILADIVKIQIMHKKEDLTWHLKCQKH